MSTPVLEVNARQQGQVHILSVSGELDIATAHVLTGQAALPGSVQRLIVDLSGLRFIDCAGARALAAVTQSVPPDCPVVVRGAARRIRKILDMLGLPLECCGDATLNRAEWLVLEAQVLCSWAEQASADTRALVAASREIRDRRVRVGRHRLKPVGSAPTS